MAVNIDWNNLDFGYIRTPFRFVANYRDGKWDGGELSKGDKVIISESAGVIQYAQSVFEGLKAYTTKDGRIVTFRPDLNAARMTQSAARMEMPILPDGMFIRAVEKVVRANADYIPPYGTGAALYLRPVMFATSPVLGVKPAQEYQFRLFASPVGPYFKNGVHPLTLKISDFDRAAPRGTGHVKAGLNYGMSLHAVVDAHRQGYDENIYLDPATHTYIEETGGANILFVTDDERIVTPKSDSILPSITKRSLCYVAEKYLGFKVENRPVRLDELKDFTECGLCGTAAVICPVGKIVDHGKFIFFPSGMEKMGEVTKKLYDILVGIQMGTVEAPSGWIHEIKMPKDE